MFIYFTQCIADRQVISEDMRYNIWYTCHMFRWYFVSQYV